MASAQGFKQGTLSNVKRLTSGAVRYEAPQWSPDGTRISLTEEGFNSLFVMDKNGGNFIKISSASGVGYLHKWSADSRDILVRDTRWIGDGAKADRLHAIWSISLDGTKTRLSNDARYMQPASWRYSSNGVKTIVTDGTVAPVKASLAKVPTMVMKSVALSAVSNVSFITDPLDFSLYVVDANGTKRKINAEQSFNPVLSPNGKMVAFDQGDDVAIMNIDGSGKRIIARGYNPTWVNNSQIIYERTTDDGHKYTSGELYINSANGGAEKALTSTSARIERYPVVSPDGSKLIFISNTDGQLYQADLK